MSRPSRLWVAATLCLLAGCEQLGNPPQFATGPTRWTGKQGHLVTTTRSFRNEKTIRRLVSEGLGELDYKDAAIGPSQTLTLVSVASQGVNRPRRRSVKLVTTFQLKDRRPVVRRWSAPPSSRHWTAAFSLPQPPRDAITSVAP